MWPAVSPAASPQHAPAVQSSMVPAVAEQGLADAQQQGLANVLQQPWLELQDQVLRNVLGVGLQQVQEGAAEVRQLSCNSLALSTCMLLPFPSAPARAGPRIH